MIALLQLKLKKKKGGGGKIPDRENTGPGPVKRLSQL